MRCVIYKLVFLVLLSLTFSVSAQDDLSSKVITVGIVPQQSAARLAELWVPMLEYLSRHTGYKLEFKTAKDIPAFEARVLAGEYDIAYMNPIITLYFTRPPAIRRLRGLLIVAFRVFYWCVRILRLRKSKNWMGW